MGEREFAAELFREASHPSAATRYRLVRALDDHSALVRHVAAIALAGLDPARLPESSLRELLDSLARLEHREELALEEEYMEATITAEGEDAGELGQDIVLAFTSLRCGQADFAIPRLLEFWSFDGTFYDLAHALLALALPLTNAPVEARSLGMIQRDILDALLNRPGLWIHDLRFPPLLSARGLPQSGQEMRDFLSPRAM